MDPRTTERLFGWWTAFDNPVTLGLALGIAGVLVLSGIAIALLRGRDAIDDDTKRELSLRWWSWLVIAAVLLVPILAGAAWTIVLVLVLSLACYREYARTTGLFRERGISVVVVLAILALTFATLDNFERLFLALGPIGVVFIVVGTIGQDRPKGFVQRVALGVLGYLLFGFSLGYLGRIANDADYRPLLLLIIVAVSLNDVFAYCCGKLIGGPKWLPTTSPGKTIAGALGALVLTTIFVACVARPLFAGTDLDHWGRLATLGIVVSGLGQLGDLVLSSIKRDVGVKDVGAVIPGHGGLLDRFDSLLLVPPAVYHYVAYYLGAPGSGEPVRIITG